MPSERQPLRLPAVFFGSAGLALLIASALAFLACWFGFLFSGISAFLVVLAAGSISALATTVTAVVFRRRHAHFGGHTLLLEVSILAFVAVGSLSWLDTRKHMAIFLHPATVPAGLNVRQGRRELFTSYLHFTGPPATLARLIQAKGLLAVPAEPPEGSDNTAFFSVERSKVPWIWWRPTTMSGPRFYFLYHQAGGTGGWSEGWWVSGQTNEVYAFIGG